MLVSRTSFSDFSFFFFFLPGKNGLPHHNPPKLSGPKLVKYLHGCLDQVGGSTSTWDVDVDVDKWMFGRAYQIFIAMFENT
jgi:hypothetical protein